jgi:RNA polymerase-binding protein DksA
MSETKVKIDKKIIDQIKDDLLARKQKLLDDLRAISGQDAHEKDQHRTMFPSFGDKPDDNAQEIDSYTTNLATEKIFESGLRDIDNALKRIEDGSYGICKYCSKEIGEKRLLARPVASACVECKNKLQNGTM